MLTVGSVFEGQAIDVDYLGQGIVKHEELVIFVKGLLIDEVALIRIKTLKKRFAEGHIVELIKESPDRIEHVDTYLGSMDLLHMRDEAQLVWQSRLTKDTLKKIGDIDVLIEPIITDGKFTHYRNKSVFHVMEKPVFTCGLYHEDGRGLVPVTSFLLADELTNKVISKLSQANIYIDFKALKQIAIRTNQKQALVTLVSTKKTFKGLSHLLNVLHNVPEIIGITLNIKDDKNKILGTESHLLKGEPLIEQKIGNWSFAVSDISFFQINVPVASMVYDLIKKHLKPESKVVDAYSGVGSIGFYLSEKASHVLMIESNPDAVKMAIKTKDMYQMHHVDIVLGQAEHMTKNHECDALIVDPPRNGLMPELVETMIDYPFDQVFYLSCDLKTLSRDLGKLKERYAIEHVYPIRMFPQTTECETLVIMKRK